MANGLTSQKLFGRACRLTVGVPDNPLMKVDVDFNDSNSHGLDVSGFDFEFVVEKTLKPEPNTCSVTIYNLSETSRQVMSGGHKLTLKLEAGYQGGTSLIYLGDVRSAWTERSGPDFITHLESGDGEKEMRKARLNVAYGAKVPITQALGSIVAALGLGQGNVPQIAALLATKGIASIHGGALNGSAAQRLTDFCRSAGLEWSVQNGNIQILNLGQTISKQAIQISADTGMIESPTVDNEGIVSVSTLIIPGIQPGGLVVMDSLFVKGGFRIERCKWHGQVFGNDWQTDLELRKF